jgi:diguanylate cyclase (GGDEF)-like protein
MGFEAPPAGEVEERVHGLIPDDPRQALRIRRYLMAAGTSMLAVASLFIAHRFGLLPWSAALEGTAMILILAVIFYLLFRFGLNRQFSDPSLTTEMIVCAIIVLAYLMYQARDARNALSLFYLAAMLFGVLRLSTPRLMSIAGIALLAHGTMLYLSELRQPGANGSESLMQFAVLAVVLPWFAAMGGYVNALRQRLSDSNRQLKIAFERIEQVAIHDELTGVFNRRFLMDVLTRESSRAKRLGTAFSACLFDLDHFKNINDTLGHAAGDAVLKHFARLGGSGLRAVDVFGRYGGEEFLLVLPDTGQPGACASAERVRAAFENARVAQLPVDYRLSVTVGIATSRPGEDIEALLGRADAALYEGKAAGRNRIVAVG